MRTGRALRIESGDFLIQGLASILNNLTALLISVPSSAYPYPDFDYCEHDTHELKLGTKDRPQIEQGQA